MRFDLVDLRLFVAIIEGGSISRGADTVHLALASASARVSGMEATLGASLLTRNRRGVVPTAAGRTLLHHARTVLAQIERMRGDLREFGTGLKGEIRMLSNTAALVELVPLAVSAFLIAHPDVDIDIEEMPSVAIVDAIGKGRAEFGIVADSSDLGILQSHPLSVDELVMIASADHPLAVRENIAFAELVDEPFVGLSDGALDDHLATHAARLGKRITYRVRLRSFDTVARFVEAGIGISIVPRAAVRHWLGAALATIPISDRWAHRRLMGCAVDFAALSIHARALVDEICHQATLSRKGSAVHSRGERAAS